MKNLRHVPSITSRPLILATTLVMVLTIVVIDTVGANGHHTPSSTGSDQASLSSSFAAATVQSYDLETTDTLRVANFDNAASFPITVDGVGTFVNSTTSTILDDNYYRAGNSGKYILAQDMVLTLAAGVDYSYVGFYWAGGNAENHVQLLDENNALLAEFSADVPDSTEDLFGRTGTCQGNATDYCGSPNVAPNGDNDRFAFVHLRYAPGFRKVRFYGFNFEVDNVTVSQTLPGVGAGETTTEVFNPFTISTPSVVIADPRSNLVSFPGLTLGAGAGETNAMICFSQVEIGGATLSGQPFFSATGSGANITTANETNLQTFRGARDTVVTFSSTIDFAPVAAGQRFGIVGSRYFRLTATPQSNIGSAACSTASDNSVSTVVELRFLNSNRTNSFDIPID
jgi:hypothetical protein